VLRVSTLPFTLEPMSDNACPSSVLVVEDDDDIRMMIGEVLEDAGYVVGLAESGQRALDLIATLPRPCLVLADLIMPDIDGWELMSTLSSDDRFATIPVIVISAWDSRTRPIDAVVIKKPFDMDVLLHIVHDHCCSAAGAPKTVARLGSPAEPGN
jgi:CheY-like chemotaxis protein